MGQSYAGSAATFINFLKIPNGLKLQFALPTLESPSQGPLASEDNSTVPTFRLLEAPFLSMPKPVRLS